MQVLCCIQNFFLNDSNVLARILQEAYQDCKRLQNVIESMNCMEIVLEAFNTST